MSLDGLNTVQQPAARTGASSHAAIRNGSSRGQSVLQHQLVHVKIRERNCSSRILALPSSASDAACKVAEVLCA